MVSIPLSTVPFIAGIIAFLTWGRRTEPPLPIWIMSLVGGGAILFVVLNFLAFHRVRVERHAAMAQTITDCQVVLVGGMGWGAYDSLKNAGIEPIITNVEAIDEAVKLYLQGTLTN